MKERSPNGGADYRRLPTPAAKKARSLLRLKNGYVRDDAAENVSDWNPVLLVNRLGLP